MVTITQAVECSHCQSTDVVRNGRTRNGKQRFLCHACGRNFRENSQAVGYSEERKHEILRAYEERSSLRGLERTFGVARQTVAVWLKKRP
jgi:transposase-like protein